uniref:Strawberry notch helicase C domain-containing protein n=1 Tax=Rhizochromulina marina TaxID=1034831 RepID=A0A7S2RU64_9STRA
MSWTGAEFANETVNLSPEFLSIYDQAADFMSRLRKEVIHATMVAGVKSILKLYWSMHIRFFKELCIAAKVDAVVEMTKEALNDGYAVVIGMQTTGEASIERAVGNADECMCMPHLVSNAREILLHFIRNHIPTTRTTDPLALDDTSDSLDFSDFPEEEGEVECTELVNLQQQLLEEVKAMELPASALDALVDRLGGPKSVAEMTGRKGRVVRISPDSSEFMYQLRHSYDVDDLDNVNVQEKKFFMAGTKNVAIISDAASTGISLHSDVRFKNTRRRLHITLELPWSADKAIQQLGRSHRSNQASPPVYRLVTTDLGGEKRFASSVARRLMQLGALTRGDRRAAIGGDWSDVNQLETKYGVSALKELSTRANDASRILSMDPYVLSTRGHSMPSEEDETLAEAWEVMDLTDTSVKRFLNRLLGCRVSVQNTVFAAFSNALDNVIKVAKADGEFEEGVSQLLASSVELVEEPICLYEDAITKSRSLMYRILTDRGVSFDQALSLYLERIAETEGMGPDPAATLTSGEQESLYDSQRPEVSRAWAAMFLENKRPLPGNQRMFCLAVKKSDGLYYMVRPNTGRSNIEKSFDDIRRTYKVYLPEERELRRQWTRIYDDSALPNTKLFPRHLDLVIIAGSILPVWKPAHDLVVRTPHLTKKERSLRMCRVTLNDSTPIVGIQFPPTLCDDLRRVMETEKAGKDALLSSRTFEEITPIDPAAVSAAAAAPRKITSYFSTGPRVRGSLWSVASLDTENLAPEDTAAEHSGSTQPDEDQPAKRRRVPGEDFAEDKPPSILLDQDAGPESGEAPAKPTPLHSPNMFRAATPKEGSLMNESTWNGRRQRRKRASSSSVSSEVIEILD